VLDEEVEQQTLRMNKKEKKKKKNHLKAHSWMTRNEMKNGFADKF